MILSKEQAKQQDEKNWPQTDQVFDLPKIDFQSHRWRQEGYFIIDCCPTCVPQGIPIPYGKMLIKKDNKYLIVDEM